MRSVIVCIAIILTASTPTHAQEIHPRTEYAGTLVPLADALLTRQMKDPKDPNFGGIWCSHCNVWHTRAAEAMYPFAITASITGDKKFLTAAINAGNWLIRQQQPNGSWKETPEEWTGTTTDQLLMMLQTYPKIKSRLSAKSQQSWLNAMHKAAAYLDSVMSPEFASINYVSTTTATLAKAGLFFNEDKYLQKARALAHRTISKMDRDGFLNGEGGRSHNNKMGVDLGYDMEMSLWGLGLYARLTHDTGVDQAVRHALANHLFFIYPDGSLDASWGIRSNKWTGYGSATSDGCHVLFALYADEDPQYANAACRNLAFLRQNITDSLIGYGLQYAALFQTPPCIYPTFAKSKSIAMAYELDPMSTRPSTSIPADRSPFLRTFPTLDLIQVRTAGFMATITAYRYKDPAGTRGKYMYRATGGTISHLWCKDIGFLQASSPTVYTRPEPMSFPEAPGVLSLTPRIEYTDTAGYFTNQYEYDASLDGHALGNDSFAISCDGQLKDKNQLGGGVSYTMDYLFTNHSLTKTIRLSCHDDAPSAISIVEPFINPANTTFTQEDDHHIQIAYPGRKLTFTLLSGNASLVPGQEAARYWTPYPALKAFPITLEIHPAALGSVTYISYRIDLIE